MSWAEKRCRRVFRSTVDHHRMLADGDAVIVGVSGGADSLCLLHLLHGHDQRHHCGWHVHAVHVDPGFPGWNSRRVVAACARIGVVCEVLPADITRLREAGRDSCYLCARERRKALFRHAATLDCRKIALAHSMDDVNETFLMNLLFTSAASTFVPRQPLFGGKVEIIRPLYRLDKELVRRCLKDAGLRPVRNRCPRVRAGARAVVRRFCERLYHQDPRIRTNLFWGLHNLRPKYLPGADKSAGGGKPPPDSPMGI
jgi:tRNA 2-thiocytidine biosynthesis protein TtcA